ncbi:hypothetical protein MBLNU230_g2216t1 [Neophaeotheca triangularis]
MPPKGPSMTWDAAADRKMFLRILKQKDISIDYDDLAAYMSTDTITVTKNAITKRFGKLRELAAEEDAAAGDGENTATTPKSKASPTKKRKNGDAADTPSKKAKATPKPKKPKAKVNDAEVESEVQEVNGEGSGEKEDEEDIFGWGSMEVKNEPQYD